MGRHDEVALMRPRPLEVFENFVRYKRELLLHLQKTLERDQEMLDQMRGDAD